MSGAKRRGVVVGRGGSEFTIILWRRRQEKEV
jgi:hypothetical protein